MGSGIILYSGARLYLDLMDEWILEQKGAVNYRPHPFEYFGAYGYLERKYGERFILDRR